MGSRSPESTVTCGKKRLNEAINVSRYSAQGTTHKSGTAAISVDRYAVHVGRWLVTRDGFDFLVYYLPDYDHASHAAGGEPLPEHRQRSGRWPVR